MYTMKEVLSQEIDNIKQASLYKQERRIFSPQGASIEIKDGFKAYNLCANNYLGLAQNSEVNAAAMQGLKDWGYGMASVRFICGTQSIHRELENKLTEFLQTEDTILYPSCFDANGGLFETLLGPEDAIISDELNHASIIDGVRLCKASRYRYKNNDMKDLELKLIEAKKNGARFILISTDGVFSMDGYIAQLDKICDLADNYGAMVHFDDAHATGFVGENGRGTHEYCNCIDRIDITTGTLGKALGGASGGYTSGKREIIELLKQRSRPYLFSNSVAPSVVTGAIKALDLAMNGHDMRRQLAQNTAYFRAGLEELGFDLLPGDHAIVPIMTYKAELAVTLSEVLLKYGVYVIPFSFPVVPRGKARIRTQMSAAFSKKELAQVIAIFAKAKAELGI